MNECAVVEYPFSELHLFDIKFIGIESIYLFRNSQAMERIGSFVIVNLFVCSFVLTFPPQESPGKIRFVRFIVHIS